MSVCFGAYELDCRTNELRRDGALVKLQPQPAKVLSILVSRAGEVVTRQELIDLVWGTTTYVDYEHGLNFAIRQIRSVLGDEVAKPQYLETVPKMGYRFIAAVTNGRPDAALDLVVPRASKHRWKIFVPSALFLLVALAGVAWYLRRSQPPAETAPIVLGEFVNGTGDPIFNGTLRHGLSVQLQQSPFLRFISDEQIQETLRMMGRAPNTQLSPEVAREVCRRSNADVTFAGSIDQIGTGYAMSLRAIGCAKGDVLATAGAQAKDKEHVLEALSQLASDMRGKLGEPLNSVRQHNMTLASVTTPSLQALQSYTQGLDVLYGRFDYAEALSWFQKAIELDPNFATAYWAIGDVYAILGESDSATQYTRKSFELREHVSEREKALIEAHYYYYVLGDIEKARRSCELLAKLYPYSEDAHTSLATFAETVGQYDVGMAEFMQALRLAPGRSYLYRDLAYSYLVLEHFEEATSIVERAHAMNLDENLTSVRYSMAFYRNDRSTMAREVASVAGKPGIEDLLLALDADTAAYSGHLEEARSLSQRAAISAARAGRRETSASYYAASALREALFGNSREAQQEATLAGKYPVGRDTAYGIALAFAYAGDLSHMQALTDDLAKRFPEDTVVNCNYLPTLRAQLALMHSRPAEAIDLLAPAARCELGLPVYSYYNWPNLYPAYVRGQALLAAHRPAEAVAEFEKILSHRGLVLNEPIGALSRLQLGRAYMSSGDVEKARNAYQSFLELWKDAEPKLAVLQQAQTEYRRLPAAHQN